MVLTIPMQAGMVKDPLEGTREDRRGQRGTAPVTQKRMSIGPTQWLQRAMQKRWQIRTCIANIMKLRSGCREWEGLWDERTRPR